ncbi:MAG: hypothetical protein ABW168_07240 [Sedimenticola sp.]
MDNDESNVEQNHSGPGHNIARDMNVYNFGKHDFATDLAIAILIGAWDETKISDISFIESVTKEQYSDWVTKIRQIESGKNSPLLHDSGRWSVRNRVDAWKNVASRLFNDHLDRFKEGSIEILCSIDPKFDLKPEDRYAASIYGKVQSHSIVIRNGISEGLALISTANEYLTNCSNNYGEIIANSIVKEVFSSSNWKLWASTQDIQPVMAEAAPNEFLDAVEAAVIHLDKPFNALFSQEGVGGITGANYMTGLLWALESLAWSPVYLTRSVVLLGEMDSHDPGGNWANRPANSIIDILLPWHPHTTASFDKRLASIKALEREFPKTAWKVLLQLLPTGHGFTSGTSKPKWRKFIPNNFSTEVSYQEYFDQTCEYGNYIIELARKDLSRLPQLVQNLDHLHEEAFNATIELLHEYSETNACAEEKYALWLDLLTFINKHKKFYEAEWSLSSEKLNKLRPVEKNLQPVQKELLYRRLFTNKNMDLYEEKGNWREQEEAIRKLREKAVSELFLDGGHDLVYKFSQDVESSNLVGNTLAAIVKEDNEDLLLEYLATDNIKIKQYLAGYVWSRNHLTKGMFSEQLDLSSWGEENASKFLLLLPFEPKTWDIVETILGGSEYLYWTKVNANAYQCNDEEESIYRSINALLMYGRPLASIHCIYQLLHMKKSLKIEPTVRALIEAVNTKESISNLDSYEMGEIIEYIQGCDQVSDDDRFKIEWAYLPLISNKTNDKGSPIYLEKRLSNDPKFFCEIIQLAYKSDKDDSEIELSEAQKNMAKNAYNLLDEWRLVPGTLDDGSFDGNYFDSWFESVSNISKISGYSYPILRVIGKTLINAPKSKDGLWIEIKLAEFLNQRQLEGVRDAYRLAIYNSRGVHWVDPEAKAEIKLSEEYLEKSEKIDLLGLQRFSRTLRDIAEGYASEAESIIKRHSRRTELKNGKI